jgi:hypothetical protein
MQIPPMSQKPPNHTIFWAHSYRANLTPQFTLFEYKIYINKNVIMPKNIKIA